MFSPSVPTHTCPIPMFLRHSSHQQFLIFINRGKSDKPDPPCPYLLHCIQNTESGEDEFKLDDEVMKEVLEIKKAVVRLG